MRGEKAGPHKRIRKFDRSHAEIILRVRQFFEMEKSQKKRICVNRVVERTVAATGANHNIVSRIRSQEDIESWQYHCGDSLKYEKKSSVPESFRSIVRMIVRDLFLEKVQVPTVTILYNRISTIQVKDVVHLNLFN